MLNVVPVSCHVYMFDDAIDISWREQMERERAARETEEFSHPRFAGFVPVRQQ